MTSTIQQNEDEPSSHLGFRSGRPYLNEREKVLVKELLRKYCSRDDWEDGSACSTNECFVQTYAVGKSGTEVSTYNRLPAPRSRSQPITVEVQKWARARPARVLRVVCGPFAEGT